MARLREAALQPGLAEAVAAAALAHVVIWTVGAWLVIDNLHLDTLEIVGWANDWALVYPKHPPLATWIAKVTIAAPGPGLPAILLVSQCLVAASALFVWKIARLYGSASAAAIATTCFLVSPAASYFAIQYNHNLVLTPPLLATLYFHLRYLERRAGADAFWLGVSAGLAFLAKYEAVILFVTLLMMILAVPRFRGVLREKRNWIAIASFVAIVSPHLFADWTQGGATIGYAAAARPLRSAADGIESLNQLFDGALYALVAIALTAMVYSGSVISSPSPGRRPRFALYIALAPIAILVVLSLLSRQIIRQGWVLPLVPFVAIGLALRLGGDLRVMAPNARRIRRRAILISAGQLAALALFFVVRDVGAHPIASYAFDSSEMSEGVEKIWAEQGSGPLACIAAPSRTVAQSPLITLSEKPRFVDLESFAWSEEPPCAETGGLTILPAGWKLEAALEKYRLPRQGLAVRSESHLGGYVWTFSVYVSPPRSRDR